MADLKHTRTYNKLKFSKEVVNKVRDWSKAKGICIENASVVKVIGTKQQVDELDALLKPLLEEPAPKGS